MSAHDLEERFYPATRRQRVFRQQFVVACVVVAVVSILAMWWYSPLASIIAGVLITAIGLSVSTTVLKHLDFGLRLTSAGIFVVTPGAGSVPIPWEALQSIAFGRPPWTLSRRHEYIVGHLNGRVRAVPVYWYGTSWRTSDVGVEIRRRASHLFEA